MATPHSRHPGRGCGAGKQNKAGPSSLPNDRTQRNRPALTRHAAKAAGVADRVAGRCRARALERYAAKVVSLLRVDTEEKKQLLLDEIKILQMLDHPHIVMIVVRSEQ